MFMEESPLKPVIESLKGRPIRKVLIFVDSREFNSEVVNELEDYDCIVKQKLLVVGDYLLSDRVCIERKTTQDFVNSIIDQRLFNQIRTLKDNFEKPVLLIEGEELYDRINPNAVRGALASIALDYNVPIIWTRTPAESAGIIYWIARREQIDERREPTLRINKRGTFAQKQESLIAGLPGISAVRARALLKYFKKPVTVFSASEKELSKVEGIGKKTAHAIREILDKEYT